MKKTSKIFGAVALSAALAMGAVPAFAAVGDGDATAENVDKFADDKTQSTMVHIAAKAPQVDVTIPLKATVVAQAQGGNITGVPSNYQIINNSELPVKVVNIVAAEQTGWEYINSDNALDKNTSTTATNGAVTLAVNDVKIKKAGTQVTFPAADWTIAAKAADAGTPKVLTLSGSTSAIKTVDANGELAAIPGVNLTYTIELTSLAS